MNEELEITQDLNMKKTNNPAKNKKFIFIITVIIIIIAGLYFYNHALTYVSTDDAYIEGHLVEISPKISGNIIKVYVDDNEKVKKGQVLAEIDPIDYQVKLDKAKAKLQAALEKQKGAEINVNLTSITSQAFSGQANSSVDMAKAAVDISEKQINQANSNLELAKNEIISSNAELELVKIDYDRYNKLFNKGAISKQELDKVSTALKTLTSKYNSSLDKKTASEAALESAYVNKESSLKALNIALEKQKGADTVSQQVSISDSHLKIAQAELKQLQAELKQAEIDFSYTKIYSPESGYVTGKSAEEGVYVHTGQPILTIVPDKRWVIANFKETQLTRMKIGQLVTIKVDAYPGKVFKGRVKSFQFSTGSRASLFPPENAVGSYVKVVQRVPVKIIFSEEINPAYTIVPGMSVIPEIKIR